MRDLSIAYGNSRTAKFWSNKTIRFDDLCERLKTPIRTSETAEEYPKLSKNERDQIKDKGGFDNKWNNKYVEVTEQVGRLGCFGFMIINIPGTWFGWWSDETFAVYLIVDTILVMLYCAIWIICFKKNSVFRALALSIIPSMLFLFSGIMSRSVLLIIASVLFAPSHIMISYKNVK